jgi:hypothetical protein
MVDTVAPVAPVATGVKENTVSNWAAPVVGGIINAAVDYAANPYQVYGGATVAGPSDLQNQAFSGIQALTVPNSSQVNAGTNLQDTYLSAMTQPGYTGTDFTKAGNALNQTSYTGGQDYTKVGTPLNQTAYSGQDFTKAGNALNQAAYTGTKFTSNTTGINDQFGQSNLNQYMNPYLSTILNPQLEEARRQSQITQNENNARMTQAGAFGGGRQAILNAETQRNLGTKLADITGRGYENAYAQALGQYNTDQSRLLDALKAREQSGQYSYSKDAERLANDRAALLESLKAREQSGQYGYSKDAERLTNDRAALLESLRAKELSNQYGYTKDAERLTNDRAALLESLKAGEQSKQFGSNQGLNYLKLAAETAQNQAQFGNQLADKQLAANLRMADLGDIQRNIEQQGLTSDYEQFKEARDYPKTQIEFLNNVMKQYPMTTTNEYGEPTSALNSTIGGALTGIGALGTLGTAADAISKLSGTTPIR